MRTLIKTLLAASLLLATTGLSLAAPTVINVTLASQPLGADMPTDLGMGMGTDKSKATMSVTAEPATAPAGEISFVAKNASTDLVHEMILIKVTDPSKPLPYLTDQSKVDEDAAGHLGEVSELDPGKSGTLTLTLDPGTYMLLCNVPGHYMAGMWTTITVK